MLFHALAQTGGIGAFTPIQNPKSRIQNGEWLPRKDSNLDKEIQNLWCYRYTTRQCWENDLSAFALIPQVLDRRSAPVLSLSKEPPKVLRDAVRRSETAATGSSLSFRGFSAQPDFGAFTRGFHFERAAAFDHEQTGALQHFVDLVIVMPGVVVEQK